MLTSPTVDASRAPTSIFDAVASTAPHRSSSPRRAVAGALHIVGPALARKAGLKLTIGGRSACATKNSITLPALPVDDQQANTIGFGHLWHECNHHKYSDFDALAASGLTGFAKSVFGSLEDIYSDARGYIEYPGARGFRNDLIEILRAEGRLKEPSESSSPAAKMENYIYWRLASEIWRLPATVELAQKSEELALAAFSRAVMIKVDALSASVRSCSSTSDCINLSRRIAKLIEDEANPPEPPPPPSPHPSPDADENEADQLPQQEESVEGDSQADPQASPTSDPGQQDAQPDADAPTPEQRAALSQVLHPDAEHMDDVGDLTKQALEQLSASAGYAAPDVPSDPGGFSPTGGAPLGDERFDLDVRNTSNALRQRISRLLVADTQSSVHFRTAGSKVSSRRLCNLAVNDFRVFPRRLDPNIQTDTAFMLLADRSYSTRPVIHVIRESLYAACVALERIDRVSVAAAAFPSADGGIIPLKHFGQRAAARSGFFSQLNADGGTPLAEAMLWAAPHLAAQPKSRKVLVVITDGDYPAELGAPVLRAMKAQGINAYAIGVGADADVPWFEVYQKIQSVAELPQAMFDLLMLALRREGLRA